MEPELIIWNNALIADFMGLKLRAARDSSCLKKGSKFWYSPVTIDGKISSYSQICIAKEDGLSYHWDWNRLIKVVEKIESMDFRVDIFYRYTQILTLDDYPVCRSLANRSDKKSGVYEAVVKFIEWHNEEKENEN